jgi:sodium/potassium-transporting ATPase subunit alpha
VVRAHMRIVLGSSEYRATRIQFQGDEETGRVGREREAYRDRRLSRASSTGSLSIHSAGGGSRTVQPETALPITYRTL